MEQHYSIGEFAKKTGVTVRTLHYYDELAILTPHRSESGRRFYDSNHFVTMQKIVTLKYLGYSLEQMKDLLSQNNWNIKESLMFQKQIMEENLRQLERTIQALDHAIHLADEQENIDASIFSSIIQGIQFQDEHKEWLKGIYPEEKVEKIFNISSEKQLELEKEFSTILSALKLKFGLDPSDSQVQLLMKDLITLFQEVVGEDVQSFIKVTSGSASEEEDPLYPLPLTREEEEWVGEAIKIYLHNGELI
ncbi:MerR family transcriptional regulator [Bacillus sp. 31A1R]|uniref:MerR family transcriptional regulator n=1 Tax=Robertmurraya mangrovi TaxID=3098077 RepID=A0ABU5J0B7_9BACI|nr:MerR family transcriptional regulator [Bacillus sp. 31A1R]MDZ5472826.1 MerR family transcriptional regulator [Bacillus sp. 31A1R]